MKKTTLIIDADSIIFASAVTSDNLEDAFEKVKSKTSWILKRVSEKEGSIDSVLFCHGSYSNWRKSLFPTYKANRSNTPVPDFLGDLHRECEFEYDGLRSMHDETDDLVVDLWRKEVDLGKNVVISAIDKDFHQVPAKFYDFKNDKFYSKTELESLEDFYTQMIVGDSADNIKTCKGYGKSKAKKILEGCTSKYQFVRRVYELYKGLYKGKAYINYIKTYQQLKLGKRE